MFMLALWAQLLCCLVSWVFPPVEFTASIIGIGALNLAGCMLYLVTSEIYPTSIRIFCYTIPIVIANFITLYKLATVEI